MGRYVTCKYCGASAKSIHPGCDCLSKRITAVIDKIKGSTIVDTLIQGDYCYTFMYTHYSKETDEKKNTFYVRTVVENGCEGFHIDEYLEEISQEDFQKVKKGICLICPSETETETETGKQS